MDINEAIEKLSSFITMVYERGEVCDKKLEEIEEVESAICRFVEKNI